jgi:polyisoprenoid-binding protein YceI
MNKPRQFLRCIVLSLFATLALTQAQSSESAPVFKITPVVSKITFYVKSSVHLEGTFEKWETRLVFASTDASTGVLDIKIQADSVNTGSESKDKKLKGEHCFDVEKNPYITFHSTKITHRQVPILSMLQAYLLFVASRNPSP